MVWCLFHSLLIHPPVEQRLERLLGRRRHVWRLLYNLIALASLVPVGMVYLQAQATPLLEWPAWLNPLQWTCWLAAIALILAGARAYDTGSFLGLKQWRDGRTDAPSRDLAEDTGFVTTGIMRHSRHPWYLAGLLLLWSRDLSARGLVTSLVLTVYLLAGILLEERKLVRRFGQAYRQYQRNVPMLWNPFRGPRP